VTPVGGGGERRYFLDGAELSGENLKCTDTLAEVAISQNTAGRCTDTQAR